MAFNHGKSEGAITGFLRSNRIFGVFFKNTLINGFAHWE